MRDLSVEFMRCVACVFVVGVHMMVGQQFAGDYALPRVFLSCFFADGVAVFWMITGFFMFGSKSYPKMLKRTFTKIFIPMALLSLFAFFLFYWYAGYAPLEQSVQPSLERIERAVHGIFEWSNGVDGTDHLWYLYTYILVVLIFPLLNPFVQTLKSCKSQLILLAVIFGAFFLNDLAENRLFEFSTKGINGLVPATMEVLWGYVLYQNRELFRGNWKLGFATIAAFLAINALRTGMLMYNYGVGNANHFLFWHSAYALLTASCVVIACFAFVPQQAKGRIGRAIIATGACTFMIYVVHMVIRDYIMLNLENPLYQDLFANAPGAYGAEVFGLDLAYLLIAVAFVFFASLMIVLVGKKLLALCKKTVTRIRA